MKSNFMSDVTKVLILVATVIVVCIICAVGFKMVNEGKSSVNASTNNFNNMTSQYQDIDKAIYDGATVQGSEVESLIKKILSSDDVVAIRVSTKASTGKNIDYNYEFTPADDDSAATIGDKSEKKLTDKIKEGWYINPSASFTGKVHKDVNNIIICIEFTQV